MASSIIHEDICCICANLSVIAEVQLAKKHFKEAFLTLYKKVAGRVLKKYEKAYTTRRD